VLVTVATPDERAEEARAILARHHPIDLSQRAEEWRQSGWTRFEPGAEPSRPPAAGMAAGTTGAVQASQAVAAAAAPRDKAEQDITIPV
jgi:hypothetical protein